MNRLPIFVLIVFSLLAGCESNMLGTLADDSGKQADIQEARMAVDDANYDKAISLLLDYYDPTSPDPEVAGILSSAYMGKAGLDLSYVFQNIGAAGYRPGEVFASALSLKIIGQADPASSQLAGTKSLSDNTAAWFISASSIEGLLESLENAQSVLASYIEVTKDQGSSWEDDAAVKLGIASALHFIMKTGYIVSQVTHHNIPLNRNAYLEVFPEDTDWMSLLDDTSSYIDEHPDDLTYLKTDLTQVFDAVVTLTELIGVDDGITGELDGFTIDLLGIPESADGATVRSVINAYTGEDFTKFVHNILLAYD
jgi:DNA-binding transcriptional regulator YiaG